MHSSGPTEIHNIINPVSTNLMVTIHYEVRIIILEMRKIKKIK